MTVERELMELKGFPGPALGDEERSDEPITGFFFDLGPRKLSF